MRQLQLRAPKGQGEVIMQVAREHQGKNLAWLPGHDGHQAVDLVLVSLPNDRLDALLADLSEVPDLHITLAPRGLIALAPPGTAAPHQVVDIAPRSALEVYLSGLQSVGSWKGFLSYAAAAGALAWIGLYTDTSYLLVSAMLIAPFASPAMNLAIGTARGEASLILRSLGRYAGALATAILTAAALSWIVRQETLTAQMAAVSNLSSYAVLLPLVAGAAGALSQVQSQRSSLVSGAAVGVLVAAALAPPTALVGMSLVLGEWAMAKVGLFQLLLQLLGINLTGALVFLIHGLTPRHVATPGGRPGVLGLSVGVTVLGLSAMLAWQFSQAPELQQGSHGPRMDALIRQEVNASGMAELVEARTSFPRGPTAGPRTMLNEVYVLRRSPVAPDELKAHLTRRLQQRLLEAEGASVPLVTVTVLEVP